MATPRDLDPKFKDEKPVEPVELVEHEEAEVDDVPMIVHRQQYTDSEGKLNEREHRVPVSEWAEYEKEHNL